MRTGQIVLPLVVLKTDSGAQNIRIYKTTHTFAYSRTKLNGKDQQMWHTVTSLSRVMMCVNMTPASDSSIISVGSQIEVTNAANYKAKRWFLTLTGDWWLGCSKHTPSPPQHTHTANPFPWQSLICFNYQHLPPLWHMYAEKEASAETYVTCLHLVPVDINQKWTSVYLQLTAGLQGDAEWGQGVRCLERLKRPVRSLINRGQ